MNGSSVSGLWGLVYAVPVCLLGLVVHRKWSVLTGVWRRTRAQGQLQVLDSVAVGVRQRLCLVRAGDVQVLIGVSAQHMCLLHAWPPCGSTPESIADLDVKTGERP